MSQNIRVTQIKANAKYTCQECGKTEFIQAHHEIPGDDDSLICLCGFCHSKRHPKLPKSLFFSKVSQPYWSNISASSIARQVGVHPRTIWRKAKTLNIPKGFLKPLDEAILRLCRPFKKSFRLRVNNDLSFQSINYSFNKSTQRKIRRFAKGAGCSTYSAALYYLVELGLDINNYKLH